MSKITLDAGACGFKVVIKAVKKNKNLFALELVSPCEMVKSLNKELKGRLFGREVFSTIEDSEIYRLSSRNIKHISCPIPAAILKALEVEAGLAVPKDVKMRVEK